MKVFEFNSGIYEDHNLMAVYELIKTALDLGYTHVIDHFHNVLDPLPLVEVIEELDLMSYAGEVWTNLDEATKVDLGHSEMISSNYPYRSTIVFRPTTDKEKANMLNSGIPDFFVSRIKFPQVVVYYREFSTFKLGNISLVYMFDFCQKVDVETGKKVKDAKLFMN